MNRKKIPNKREIIDRRKLAAAIAEAVETGGAREASRPAVIALLRAALDQGREEMSRRLTEHPSAGHQTTMGYAFLIDQLIRVMYDHVTAHLYPVGNRSAAERIAITAVGGLVMVRSGMTRPAGPSAPLGSTWLRQRARSKTIAMSS